MPKTLPIFSSFSAGEITPRLASRADTESYKNGCNILTNMISTSHGPVIRRNGLEIIQHQTDESIADNGLIIDARIFDFSISKSLGTFVFISLFEDGTTKLTPYSPEGSIIPSEIDLITNGNFEQGATGWTNISAGTGTAIFANGSCALTPGVSNQPIAYTDYWDHVAGVPTDGEIDTSPTEVIVSYDSGTDTDRQDAILSLRDGDPIRVVETAADTRWIEYTVSGDPVDNTTYATIPCTQTNVGSPLRDDRTVSMQWTSTNQTINIAGIEQGLTGLTIGNVLHFYLNTANNPDKYNLEIDIGSTQGGNDYYDKSITSTTRDVTFTLTGTECWIKLYCIEEEGPRTLNRVAMVDDTATGAIDTEVGFDAPWGTQDLSLLQYDSPPEGNALYISSPLQPTQKLSYDPDTQGWSFAPVAFTAAPAEWTTDNYPRAITFFQGRMWLGGTPNERETFWASKSGDIENFTQGSLADDGLEFTLSEQGEISWITGAKNLIIGTARGEHIVESAGGVIIPSDIQITQQSAYGSRSIQAEKIGQKVMYVSPDGRKIREIGYQWTDDGWISRDISFGSEHITEDNNIKQVAFAQNPENLLWCVTDQGEALCCTYEKTYNVIGWHRHTTEGKFIDVASFDLNGSSIAGFIVKRFIGGRERMCLEIINPHEEYHLDSWKYQYYEEPTVEVSGLMHLAGNTVDVLTDSGVHPPIVINSNGVGYLQWSANEVVVGYNFISHLRTLSAEVIGNEGSTHAMNKGWNRVVVRILDSAKPLINDVRAPERYPNTPMDTPEEFETEDVQVTDLGWQSWDRVDVKQDLPLRLIVLGIFGEQARENL